MGRFTLFCFILCLFLPLASSGDLATDAQALLAFKAKLQSQDTSPLSTWSNSSTSSLCTNWTGITCSSNSSSSSSSQRVIAVQLPALSLSGQISPSTLGSLDTLQNLSLNSNQFFGELPPDLTNLTSLRSLFLQDNQFSGPIPAPAFLGWPLLIQIDLSFNSFNGSIPDSITDANLLLQSVNLQNNTFSGQIPDIKSSSLDSFNVANNELEGQIPLSLSSFPPSSFAGNGKLCGKPLNETCNSSTPAPAIPPASIAGTNRTGPIKLSDGAIVGIVIAAVLGGCALIFLFGLIKSRKTPFGEHPHSRVNPSNNMKEEPPSASQREIPSESQNRGSGEQRVMGEPRLVFVAEENREVFDIDKLLRASAEVMGNGSLGTAYKAMLNTALDKDFVVVVKRLNFQYKEGYKKHLTVLGSLKHENLVSIRAWYFFEDKKMLVYEYIHCSSLQALLHGTKRMEWNDRLRVAAEVANTLAYMHERQLAHGNIKSSNVLINSDNEAHLTNYGLVQLAVNLPLNSSEHLGYTAPELMDLSRATLKSDVYSFGVLLLELLTGRSPLPIPGRPNVGVVNDLPRWVQSVVQEQWTAEVFDLEIMRFEVVEEEMIELLQIALPCVSLSPNNRPSMADLAKAIDNFLKPVDDESMSSSDDSMPDA